MLKGSKKSGKIKFNDTFCSTHYIQSTIISTCGTSPISGASISRVLDSTAQTPCHHLSLSSNVTTTFDSVSGGPCLLPPFVHTHSPWPYLILFSTHYLPPCEITLFTVSVSPLESKLQGCRFRSSAPSTVPSTL